MLFAQKRLLFLSQVCVVCLEQTGSRFPRPGGITISGWPISPNRAVVRSIPCARKVRPPVSGSACYRTTRRRPCDRWRVSFHLSQCGTTQQGQDCHSKWATQVDRHGFHVLLLQKSLSYAGMPQLSHVCLPSATPSKRSL